MGDLSLRKTDVEEKRARAQKESKILLENTRKAIARLTYLKRYVRHGYATDFNAFAVL
jgi:HAUS augmin-like complex subunit 1